MISCIFNDPNQQQSMIVEEPLLAMEIRLRSFLATQHLSRKWMLSFWWSVTDVLCDSIGAMKVESTKVDLKASHFLVTV